jgi:hypothetical protein
MLRALGLLPDLGCDMGWQTCMVTRSLTKALGQVIDEDLVIVDPAEHPVTRGAQNVNDTFPTVHRRHVEGAAAHVYHKATCLVFRPAFNVGQEEPCGLTAHR